MKRIYPLMLAAAMLIFFLGACTATPAPGITGETPAPDGQLGETPLPPEQTPTPEPPPAETGKLAAIKAAGKLVLYTCPDFPPFEFVDETDGSIVGADIEIAKAIAQELGVELEIKAEDFDDLVSHIAEGRGDISISGITISEGRLQEVDFSDPYVDSAQYLILPQNSAIQTMEDLAGKTIAVAKGYTGALILEYEVSQGTLGDTMTSVIEYPGPSEALEDLKDGMADAVIMDKYMALEMADQNEALLKTIPLAYENGNVVGEKYGVAVSKGNEPLLEVINSVIKRLLDSDQVEKWRLQYSAVES